MFGRKSYSDKALTLAAAALEVVDARITWDLIDQKPEGVPRDSEWQFDGFASIFSSKRKLAAERRTSFNIGLMTGIASNYYDGKAGDLDDFVKSAIKRGVLGGKTLLKEVGRLDRKYPSMFAAGVDYAVGFSERHL